MKPGRTTLSTSPSRRTAISPSVLAVLSSNQLDAVDPQDRRHLATQPLEETLEIDRVEHRENGAVDLVGAGEIVIGRGDDGAMGVLEPVEPAFEAFHRDAAQIDDIAAERLFIGRDQGAHDVAIVENDIRLRDDLVLQLFQIHRHVAHARPIFLVHFKFARQSYTGSENFLTRFLPNPS